MGWLSQIERGICPRSPSPRCTRSPRRWRCRCLVLRARGHAAGRGDRTWCCAKAQPAHAGLSRLGRARRDPQPQPQRRTADGRDHLRPGASNRRPRPRAPRRRGGTVLSGTLGERGRQDAHGLEAGDSFAFTRKGPHRCQTRATAQRRAVGSHHRPTERVPCTTAFTAAEHGPSSRVALRRACNENPDGRRRRLLLAGAWCWPCWR